VRTGEEYLNTQNNLLLTIGGDLVSLPAGESQFSLAYEYRAEEAEFTPSAANQAGLVGSGVPTPATGGDYHTHEFSAELLVPLLGGDFKLPLAKLVELSGAYRIVDNSIAGKEDVWGVGLRWEIFDGLTLRASQSRNFRAPTLTQLFAPVSTGLGAITRDPCDADRINSGPNPAVRLANCQALFAANPGYGDLAAFQDPAENFNTALITTGGNPSLRNEVSETTTWGFVFQPAFAPGLTITVDRVEVHLTDGLSTFAPVNFLETCFDSSPQPADVCSRFTRNALGHVATADSTYFNAGVERVEGEVYNINYRFDVGDLVGGGDLGSLELGVEATHTSLRETSVTGFDLSRTDDTTATPDWVMRFDARYARGPLRMTYQLFYLPESKVNRFDTIESTPTPVIDSNARHSVSAQYEFGNVTVRGGVTNLTDEEPSFPTLTYGDILGRQYYVGVKAQF
jgi:outer membrane receptor protein involved in Fe transport